jgi:Lrp/AsnC family leucine-responsive transcriptional regulator
MTPDALDYRILATLMASGRTSWAKIASDSGLSGPSISDRVRKLENLGIIEGYSARVNPKALDCGLLVFVSVRLSDLTRIEDFHRWAESAPEVQECHIMAGPYDYLLKVRCRDTERLERLLREEVRTIPGVARTDSSIVMVSLKETSAVPLPDSSPSQNSAQRDT